MGPASASKYINYVTILSTSSYDRADISIMYKRNVAYETSPTYSHVCSVHLSEIPEATSTF